MVVSTFGPDSAKACPSPPVLRTKDHFTELLDIESGCIHQWQTIATINTIYIYKDQEEVDRSWRDYYKVGNILNVNLANRLTGVTWWHQCQILH